jgi:uroporphyrinogen III methyltransferase / synthase
VKGMVYLVGAGPGDAGLLTMRAAELIRSAEVVVIDALVSADILAMIPAGAEIIDAGKRASRHTLPQDRINSVLVEKANEGKRVVRLKGGDPFVFGRGGEEAQELRAAGVGFEMVPGISSAIAGPAYAGIPVTHRDHATSVSLITGHESDDSTGIPWESFARAHGTLVFLMGLGNLPTISAKLVENGVPPTTPVAIISHATRATQRTVTGTLADIVRKVEEAKVPTPALIVVGSVVTLRETVNWFETRPLFGRTIVVTRAREQASDLKKLLEEAGARVIQFPTIEIAPPPSWDSLDRVIEKLGSYQWLVFTSQNAVQYFFDRLFEKGLDARALAGLRIAVVGDITAQWLRDRGVRADVVPARFISTALLPLLAEDQRGIRTAVVRALKGRDELIEELRRRGGEVDLAVAYETRATDEQIDELRTLIANGGIDCVTFTSGSTAENFFAKLSEEEKRKVLARTTLASIGPTTSEAIRAAGGTPQVEAANPTVSALVEAVIAHYVSD